MMYCMSQKLGIPKHPMFFQLETAKSIGAFFWRNFSGPRRPPPLFDQHLGYDFFRIWNLLDPS